MDFSVSSKDATLANGQRAVITKVVGKVDVYTAPRLKDKLLQLEREGIHHIAVDLTEVGFIDSVGLGVLIGGLRRARAGGGTVVLAGPNPRIRRILDITGLSSAFTLAPDVDGALDALAKESSGLAQGPAQGGT
ncbi:MAG TPA: STAS domain-containing protein [Armatimonadota bacterium]|nr:STAS domain-containing protein [Armatimonadota bacterium]HPO73706.1 STAS domain-containing protein [Armatimonadota bacterium]